MASSDRFGRTCAGRPLSDRFTRCISLEGERVDAALQFRCERLVHHAMALDPALAIEGIRYDMNAHMRRFTGAMTGMPGAAAAANASRSMAAALSAMPRAASAIRLSIRNVALFRLLAMILSPRLQGECSPEHG